MLQERYYHGGGENMTAYVDRESEHLAGLRKKVISSLVRRMGINKMMNSWFALIIFVLL